MAKPLSDKLAQELKELALLRDEDIDASEFPDPGRWAEATIGPWRPHAIRKMDHDVRALANAVLERAWAFGVKPTNMDLNKLVWFVYERALLSFQALITPARVEAWDHGPVFREIYRENKKFVDQPISELLCAFSLQEGKPVVARESLEPEVARVIESVISDFGKLSSARLRGLSHTRDSAWHIVWTAKAGATAGMVIPPEVIFEAAKKRRQSSDH